MTKRKRAGGKDGGPLTTTSSGSNAAARKERDAPPVLSSNWLQLQTTLGKKNGLFTRKKIKTDISTATGTSAEKLEGAPLNTLPTSTDHSVTRVLALDCEMVGVGPEGKRSALARVSIVNKWGNVLYDKYVRPLEFITDFRTKVSGVRARDVRKAEDFFTVQKEVSEILNNRILVGHALQNDLKVLLLSHPRKNIRDTQHYGPFRSDKGRPQALKQLAASHLGIEIQHREHDSVEDARAALNLYRLFEESWEESLRQRRKAGKAGMYAKPAVGDHLKERSRVG